MPVKGWRFSPIAAPNAIGDMWRMPETVTRFAPSPTGLLHRGHAYSALLNHKFAQTAAGRSVLRIEDIDTTRCKAEFEQAIYEDLAWLGLTWQQPVRRQSARLDHYQVELMKLAERGLVYRCFKSRKDIEEAMSAPHGMSDRPFTGEALSRNDERNALAEGKPFAWRLSLDACQRELGARFTALTYAEQTPQGVINQSADPQRFGDIVLGRKDLGTSYHMASVIDDAEQGVTHIIRGEDLREAAGLHRLLQELLGLPAPVYRHHKLLVDERGERLSKRNKSETLRSLRERGERAETLAKHLLAGEPNV